MIKEIHLHNFQGHTNTQLVLSPGVNVITGSSNSGKSSIIRAIWWACNNRPTGAGDNYLNWDAERKDGIAVTLKLDDGVVKRFKTPTRNGYTFIGSNTIDWDKGVASLVELVAVRTDVPEEVASLLRLGDHNLQRQHKSYFLVADSPGEVAQKLNDVAGLYMIDTCLTNAGLLVSRNQQDTNVCKARIAELDESIHRFDDVADRDTAVAALEDLDREVRGLDDTIEFMENAIGQLQKFTDELARLSEFLEVETRAGPLFDLAKEIATLDDDIDYLEDAINTGGRLRMERDSMDAKIKDLETEFHRLLKDRGVCPLCQQEVK